MALDGFLHFIENLWVGLYKVIITTLYFVDIYEIKRDVAVIKCWWPSIQEVATGNKSFKLNQQARWSGGKTE